MPKIIPLHYIITKDFINPNTMVALLIKICVISTLFVFSIFLIDELVYKYPNTKFGKWWRNNVVGQVPSDDENF